eukprot:m.126759 g.126759  ORF g.126759 m.126759 type:complete len:85 (+) comp14525_c1_seq1:424-678(+)
MGHFENVSNRHASFVLPDDVAKHEDNTKNTISLLPLNKEITSGKKRQQIHSLIPNNNIHKLSATKMISLVSKSVYTIITLNKTI